MVSFRAWPNEDSPRSDTVSTERRNEASDIKYEHVAIAHDRLEVVNIKESLLSMYPNLAQWLFACEIDAGAFPIGPLKYVPLQRFAASSSKAASFHLERTHLVPSLNLIRPNLSIPRTASEIDLSGNHN